MMWRKWLFQIQERVGLTEKECRAFLVLAFLLGLGALVRYLPKSSLTFDDNYYAELDAEFRRLSERADSIDRAWRASPPAPDSTLELPVASGPIDLNLATSELLQSLPGIGPAIARRILDLRDQMGRFEHAADLLMVQGIGEKTFNRIRDSVFVSPLAASEELRERESTDSLTYKR